MATPKRGASTLTALDARTAALAIQQDQSGRGSVSVGRRDNRPALSMSSFSQPDYESLSDSNLSFSLEEHAWRVKLAQNHPEVLDLRERVTPLSRAVAFSNHFVGENNIGGRAISQAEILDLIHQHLLYEGLNKSAKTLVSESRVACSTDELDESRLVRLIRAAVADVETVYDLTIADRWKHDYAMDEVSNDLETILADLGLIEQEKVTEDVDIYVEPENQNVLLENKGGKRAIRAASLNKLVQELTTSKDHDAVFAKTFLTTYSSFTSPDMLLTKLIQRYHVPPPESGVPQEDYKATVKAIQLRVCNVLRQWSNEFWVDICDNDSLLQNIRAFCEYTLKPDGHGGLATSILTLLDRKEKNVGNEKKDTVHSHPPPDPKVPKNIFSPSLSLNDIDDEEVARQLTLAEFEIYRKIKPSELLNQAWSKPKLRWRAPHVMRMFDFFNTLSSWVSATILRDERIRTRIKTMTRMIKIAEHLKNMNNYDALMSFIAGMNNAAVYRLKFTRDELPPSVVRTFKDLETLMSNHKGFQAYRECLSKVSGPCIPYLGIFLTDLTFSDEGNPDYIEGLINFSKRKLLYSTIEKVQSYQNEPFNFCPVHQIMILFNELTKVPDEELWRLSSQREPRDKERNEIS